MADHPQHRKFALQRLQPWLGGIGAAVVDVDDFERGVAGQRSRDFAHQRLDIVLFVLDGDNHGKPAVVGMFRHCDIGRSPSFGGDEGYAPLYRIDSGFRGRKFQKAAILIYFQRCVRALRATTPSSPMLGAREASPPASVTKSEYESDCDGCWFGCCNSAGQFLNIGAKRPWESPWAPER